VVSGLAWLDSSREDQQRMRELIGMFSDKSSIDELGIGQVRDAFSDLLFPGTSTLHTRARYLLIVPWCYLAAERRSATGSDLAARVEESERTVVNTLKRQGATDGLIGRLAGVAVKTLPSAIYWSALGQYRIRHDDVHVFTAAARGNVEAEELAERTLGLWHRTIPAAPQGFPYELPGGLDLNDAEAQWIRDRMLVGAPGTLLAHVLTHPSGPLPDSEAPWADPVSADAPAEPATLLRHAELFSLSMHGAALLYNLLVAERYEAAGLTQVESPVETYRARLADWVPEITARAQELEGWDRGDMWRRVSAYNPRIQTNAAMRYFVDAWLDAVIDGRAMTAGDDERLRQLVSHREKSIKRAQSRLANERLIRAWTGASGSGRLNLRWPNVRRLITDVRDGFARGDSP
jgi:hypothetical protein